MATIPDGLRVPANDRPTIFNKTAGSWALAGGALASLFLTPFIAPVISSLGIVSALATAAGVKLTGGVVAGYLGGLLGKRQMERELTEGKPVESPTFFNRHTLSGMAIAGMVISAGLLLAGLVDVNVSSAARGLAYVVGVLGVGGAVGSFYGKRQMQDTVDQAQMILNAQIRRTSQMFAPGRAAAPQVAAPGTYRDSVPPAESALLAAKQQDEALKERFASTVSKRAAEIFEAGAGL